MRRIVFAALLMWGCQSVEEEPFAPTRKAQILCGDYPVMATSNADGSATLWARSIKAITKWDLIGPPAVLVPLNKDHARVKGEAGQYVIHAYNTDGECGTGSFELPR